MQKYFKGQRWISETEPELGLGLVVDATARTVQVFYQAANEMRHYAINMAPLKRVRFAEGDEIESREGTRLTVETITEENGLLLYGAADGTQLIEADLCDTSSFDRPETRLLGGHVDANALFDLRVAALNARHRHGQLAVRGLLGGRVDLLPHQLYIAQEVSARPLPRVLLADEVGLGKTIEACLVLHRLMVCGLVRRVLVLVPHALVHQWFVELLRRFNLSFSIFNEERCAAIEATEPGINPFHDDQLILSSIEFLTENPERATQAIACDWDLLIVDEAHHLHWSPEQTSPEYCVVERLAGCIPRLLLLTASPEQMGLESHFARLRLLDPQRYPDFETYKVEHDRYAEVAAEIGERLETMNEQERAEALDRHGPGRVIFRNTRRNMTGFPKRIPDPIPMELPEGADTMGPEDPRLDWLLAFLRENPQEKVLVIGRTRFEVSVIVDAIRNRSGVDVAHFHEQMNLVKCDRQAAWFAEPEGARVMVVSEMGGEGRNFQVASHLVLIDLPRDPELLEQRIGRLDRIGQRGDVHIHVPYLKGTEEEHVVRWLHEGLNAFAEPVVGGFELLERFETRLDDVTDEVIAETHAFYETLRAQIAAGRDRLLELSSFRPDIGNDVARQINECEQSTDLETYLLEMFEHYGVHAEALDATSYHIRPDQMFDDWFPLKPEGIRITFNRDEALIRPDTTLMSWDHPMVTGAGELVIGSERGSCAMAVDPTQETPLKLQAIYVLETVAPPGLNADRFLPPTPVSITVNHAGCAMDGTGERHLKDADPWKLLEHESIRTQMIPAMIEATRPLAEQAAESTIADARRNMLETLGKEYQRLEYLKKINNNIRKEELAHARSAITELDKTLAAARLRLDAIRIISASQDA
ncbi:RNA polymerase-associated protein RapA [Pontiella desulfatans]|uniref:RNA polymerase-associated protein RapA n=1 Tax=Pontiella desulfatans TaxID=2750659 RepID=A0A6C2U2C0_PONDE|nr:SNF2-related protein [Pontiella desulfatans]VGO14138.1 RNA polymerase-associated protein RapA [Pontiella desulfatans]